MALRRYGDGAMSRGGVRSRGAEEQSSRAEEQKRRRAEEEKSRRAEEEKRSPASPGFFEARRDGIG